ncbi:Cell division control protein 48 C-like [Abeliophyllum distichum]|uniref:Cell division control protein 48 C-like n=1 Tax=Abeliophyllum distichum TaxID=126358 RepID=A0ABD1VC33_9LAMI
MPQRREMRMAIEQVISPQIHGEGGVFVIGSMNRHDRRVELIRPGRLGKLLYIPLTTPDDRALILKALAKKMVLHIDEDINLMAIRNSTESHNLSGVGLKTMIRETALLALDRVQETWFPGKRM